MPTVICIPPRPRPDNSIAFGSSYCVTVQWMTLRNPLTLMRDDTQMPFSISSGTSPRQLPGGLRRKLRRCRDIHSCHAVSLSCDMNAPVVLAVHTLGCPLDKPRLRRSDTFPGLIELLGDVDDLCRLGFGRIDFVVDVLRNEAPDLPVDAGDDAQQLPTNTFRRHVDRDVRWARLCDVDNQQQRLSRARCRAQPDIAVDRKALLVDS